MFTEVETNFLPVLTRAMQILLQHTVYMSPNKFLPVSSLEWLFNKDA